MRHVRSDFWGSDLSLALRSGRVVGDWEADFWFLVICAESETGQSETRLEMPQN